MRRAALLALPIILAIGSALAWAGSQGGAFVADGNLISGVGRLAFNTDGGGLCNNHP